MNTVDFERFELVPAIRNGSPPVCEPFARRGGSMLNLSKAVQDNMGLAIGMTVSLMIAKDRTALLIIPTKGDEWTHKIIRIARKSICISIGSIKDHIPTGVRFPVHRDEATGWIIVNLKPETTA